MATRRRNPRSYQLRPRRSSQWDMSSIFRTSLPAVTLGTTSLTLPRASGERKGLTVVRIIGLLTVNSNVVNVTVDFAAGISLAPDATSPDPQNDVDEPWLWFVGGFTSADATVESRYAIDTKAKRRFPEPDHDLRFQLRNNDGVNAMSYRFALRVLTLLS